MNKDAVIARGADWVQRFVIGLNLCPFAKRVVAAGQLGWRVSEATDSEDAYQDFLRCLDDFMQADEPETLLFVMPDAVAEFDVYLDLLAQCEWALGEAGLNGEVQLASFHPDYRFDGVEANDPANYTNRSPWPMLHLLRNASVERATAAYPDPEKIPGRNCQLLRDMGEDAIQRLLKESC